MCTCRWPAASSASRTRLTSSSLTPVGLKSPMSARASGRPSARRCRAGRPRAARRARPPPRARCAPSRSRSPRAPSRSSRRRSGRPSACAAATVSPPKAAIRLCGTVPTPRPPHQDACASVDTPIAPAMCAAQPSPVWTSQWSWRAGKKRIGLPLAASTTLRTLRMMRVRRARHAEVDRLQVGEQRVVAVDLEHRLPGLDLVRLVERVHLEPAPVRRSTASAPRSPRRCRRAPSAASGTPGRSRPAGGPARPGAGA